MWEKVRIRQRERILGMLFMGICAAMFGYLVLALASSVVAEAVATGLIGMLCLFAIAWSSRFHRNKPGRPPIGPLSSDERAKARSKLLKPKA